MCWFLCMCVYVWVMDPSIPSHVFVVSERVKVVGPACNSVSLSVCQCLSVCLSVCVSMCMCLVFVGQCSQ